MQGLRRSNKIRFHDEKMGDVTIVEKILRSLTSKFDHVVCCIEEFKDIDVFSLDELQSYLLVHEQKMNQVQLQRSNRDDYRSNHSFVLFSDCDLTTFESVVKDAKWRKAMDDEIKVIERNDTWELFDFPKGHKTIGVKWIFKSKLKENSEVDKYGGV
ncbi:hypothetical protein ZIOFF_020783 [Zingiber officinale]|uniref:Uncharacterized protein n=1 Tax=Zingiber officinale TaxID=94328 RepID=A0A8J5LG11_ZINOF|nr:hypothetical protein ZIOFF_020783 [Zingiber officinale]